MTSFLNLINEHPASIANVPEQVKQFIDNKGFDPELSASPNDAIVSIKTDRTTPYDIYKDLLDEVVGDCEELKNTTSMKRYGIPFSSLEHESERREEIQRIYPKKISIAEPDN